MFVHFIERIFQKIRGKHIIYLPVKRNLGLLNFEILVIFVICQVN